MSWCSASSCASGLTGETSSRRGRDGKMCVAGLGDVHRSIGGNRRRTNRVKESSSVTQPLRTESSQVVENREPFRRRAVRRSPSWLLKSTGRSSRGVDRLDSANPFWTRSSRWTMQPEARNAFTPNTYDRCRLNMVSPELAAQSRLAPEVLTAPPARGQLTSSSRSFRRFSRRHQPPLRPRASSPRGADQESRRGHASGSAPPGSRWQPWP